jgi:hypothetical protein
MHVDETLSWKAQALPTNDLTPTCRPGRVEIEDVEETLTRGGVTAFVAALFVDVEQVAPLAHVTSDANA